MRLLLKLGWRNIFRNKKRSLLTAFAIGFGLATVIFSDGYMLGFTQNMLKGITSTFMGGGQIHNREFKVSKEIESVISNREEVLNKLKNSNAIEAYSERVLGMAMISSPANVSNILLYGIDPKIEREVSKIAKSLQKGNYLQKNSERVKRILLGYKLAKSLEVEVGEKIVLTGAQANSGELSQEQFRVGGIFKFSSRELDRGVAFVVIEDAQKFYGIGTGIHEIALKFKELDDAGNKKHPIWNELSSKDNIAEGWKSLMPGMEYILQMSNYMTSIVALILFVIVAFGIINTLFASIYERVYEFGILKALGTRSSFVVKMILTESAALAIVSGAMGIVIALVFGTYFQVVGFDYGGVEIESFTLSEPVYVILKPYQFVIYPVVTFIFTVLVAIYPAQFAKKLVPAQAIRKTL